MNFNQPVDKDGSHLFIDVCLSVLHITKIFYHVTLLISFQMLKNFNSILGNLLRIFTIHLVYLIDMRSNVQLPDLLKLLYLLSPLELLSKVGSSCFLGLASSLRLGSSIDLVKMSLEICVEGNHCVSLHKIRSRCSVLGEAGSYFLFWDLVYLISACILLERL